MIQIMFHFLQFYDDGGIVQNAPVLRVRLELLAAEHILTTKEIIASSQSPKETECHLKPTEIHKYT